MELRKVLLIVAFAAMVGIISGCDNEGKYTGGGWINGWCGGKATIGFQLEACEEYCCGTVQYNDHGAGVKFHGVVEGCDDSGTLVFGTATLQPGSETGYFEIMVTDNGEPGNEDFLQVFLTSPSVPFYINAGLLNGGNIQYHPFED